MAHITAEQALQVPQQLQRQNSHEEGQAKTRQQEQTEKRVLLDDAVTLLRMGINPQVKKVNVDTFKGEIGQDQAFLKETLRNKLAEYRLNPNTQLSIKKDMFGNLELEGSLRPSDHEKLSIDLNNNRQFKDAFIRLSKQQPTLDYVDNVVKISSAYGVTNKLFNSILSEQSEHNKLNDIAHRYQTLKHETPQEPEAFEDDANYRFTINA